MSHAEARSTDRVSERSSQAWIDGLAGREPEVEAALHELLLRAARAEISRRASSRLRVVGPELDDLAHQAAADAMVAIVAKLSTFRGESRFTTWAYKFVIFEVSGKLTRHFWAGAEHRFESDPEARWAQLPDRFGITPEQAVQARALLDDLRRAVQEDLTDHQRRLFVAIVVDGVPLDVMVERLSTTRNAIYKSIFDARRKIRARLVANGYLTTTRTMDNTEGTRGDLT